MKLCDKIAVLRRRRGWSQEDLAEWLNVARQSISRWESGRSAPDAANIVRLSRLFNVSTDWLLLDELDLSDAPAELPEEEPPILEAEVVEAVAAAPEEPAPPTETVPAVRRIRASDTYEFVVFCQGEARRHAWACAALPMGVMIFFLLMALSELCVPDMDVMLGMMGLFIGGVTILMGLCELLCSWLGKSERRLNGGEPFTLEPNALTWVRAACDRSLKKLEKRTAVAWALAALGVPAFFLCVCANPTGESVLWGGMAIALPSGFTTAAVFVRSHASRMHRCYRHLLERADQDKTPDSTGG